MWVEFSRDKEHGGAEWGFTKTVWAPTTKKNGKTWKYCTLVGDVRAGDIILHLRDEGDGSAFVGFSTAATDAFVTAERPPRPGSWGYAKEFFRADLRDYTPFPDAVPLKPRLAAADAELRAYYQENRKRRHDRQTLFFSRYRNGFRGLVGGYFSEMDDRLATIFFGRDFSRKPTDARPPAVTASTGETVGMMRRRVGQRDFSENVVANYGGACCFPACDVRDRVFLIGGHIARWADDEKLRGDTSNGLCLCVLHDKAFEAGWFVLDDELKVRINRARPGVAESEWTRARLAPHEGAHIRVGHLPPSPDALRSHRRRVAFEAG